MGRPHEITSISLRTCLDGIVAGGLQQLPVPIVQGLPRGVQSLLRLLLRLGLGLQVGLRQEELFLPLALAERRLDAAEPTRRGWFVEAQPEIKLARGGAAGRVGSGLSRGPNCTCFLRTTTPKTCFK